MQCNVSPNEQVLRYGLAGLTGLLSFFPRRRWLRGGLGLMALAEGITASTRYCPLKALLGIDTCTPRDAEPPGPAGGSQTIPTTGSTG